MTDVDLFEEVPPSRGRLLLADGPEADRVARRLRDDAWEVIRCGPGQTAEMLAAAAVDEDVAAVVVPEEAEAGLVAATRRALDSLGVEIPVEHPGGDRLRQAVGVRWRHV